MIASIVALSVFAVFFVFSFGGLLLAVLTAGINAANAAGLVVPVILIVVVIAVVAMNAAGRLRRGGKWARWLRIARFAQANGMTFTPAQGDPSYPGEIFQLGHDRTAINHLTTTSGRFLDLGNFRWITGSGKSQQTHTWGFMALSLDRNFTLYCPAEYETDALYIFTPDLMALLFDEVAPFDVELVDNWMFVYAPRPLDMTNPAVYQRLFTLADTVGAKAIDQTEHYADARVGDVDANIVAPQGARLKRGISVLAVAAVVIFAAIWGWSVFSGLFSGLGVSVP